MFPIINCKFGQNLRFAGEMLEGRSTLAHSTAAASKLGTGYHNHHALNRSGTGSYEQSRAMKTPRAAAAGKGTRVRRRTVAFAFAALIVLAVVLNPQK